MDGEQKQDMERFIVLREEEGEAVLVTSSQKHYMRGNGIGAKDTDLTAHGEQVLLRNDVRCADAVPWAEWQTGCRGNNQSAPVWVDEQGKPEMFWLLNPKSPEMPTFRLEI